MATRKTSRPETRKAVAARSAAATGSIARPAATAAATAGARARPSGGISAGGARAPTLPLRPPLERALDDLSRALCDELDALRAASAAAATELATLRAELAALRQRYDKHTHDYAGPPGAGGWMWFSLGHLRGYLGDDDDTHLDSYGVWARGSAGGSGATAPVATSPPSA